MLKENQPTPVLSNIKFGGDGSQDSWEDVGSWDDLWEWCSSLANIMTNAERSDGTQKDAGEVMRSTFGYANKIVFGAVVSQTRVNYSNCSQDAFPSFYSNQCVEIKDTTTQTNLNSSETLIESLQPFSDKYVENRSSFQGRHSGFTKVGCKRSGLGYSFRVCSTR